MLPLLSFFLCNILGSHQEPMKLQSIHTVIGVSKKEDLIQNYFFKKKK